MTMTWDTSRALSIAPGALQPEINGSYSYNSIKCIFTIFRVSEICSELRVRRSGLEAGSCHFFTIPYVPLCLAPLIPQHEGREICSTVL